MGVVMIWDLVYLVGVLFVDLVGSCVEFVVGCIYKYLNGGSGVFVFIYVWFDIVEDVEFVFVGWFGYVVFFVMDLVYSFVMLIECLCVGMFLVV